MEIRQILVPIDGSELSLRAADAGASLAARFGASLSLFTAVEPPEAGASLVSESAMEAIRQAVWGAGEAMLDQAAARVRSLCPDARKQVVSGTPAAAIAAEANTGYDLVVMGSRGLGMVPSERHLLGSVTERVLRRTNCPVMVIPEPAAE